METLAGKPQAVLDQEDAMLASLTNIAYSQKSVPANKLNATRNSKFWFKLETTNSIVEDRKYRLAPKEVEYIDAEVEGRLKSYRPQIGPMLQGNISVVREFFLTEIAPLTMASEGGTLQSKEVVQRLLDTEVDATLFSKFHTMVNKAANLKMAIFVASYFGLPESSISSLIGVEESENRKLANSLSSLPSKNDLKNFLEDFATKSDIAKMVHEKEKD
jgi:hypothetical protein